MNEEYYRVRTDNDVLADHMTLETALMLLKALFEKYYREPGPYIIEKVHQQEVEE